MDPRDLRSPFRITRRACRGDLPELDVLRHCSCGCVACPHDAYRVEDVRQEGFETYGATASSFATPERLGFRRGLARDVTAFLARRGPRPSFVLAGATTEVLTEFPAVQDAILESLRLLLQAGVGVALHTRRAIPDPVLELLGRHRDLVRVTVPLVSLDEAVVRSWEPGTATTTQRLYTLQRLVRAGVPAVVSLKPIIPFVNDGPEQLGPLVQAVADVGIRRLTAAFLRLSPMVRRRLAGRAPLSTQLLFGAYVEPGPDAAEQRPLPREKLRQAVFTRLQQKAEAARLRFGLCRCLDPDLGNSNCTIWPVSPAAASSRDPGSRAPTPPPGRRAAVPGARQASLIDLAGPKR
jgi:DNA repair photolyase